MHQVEIGTKFVGFTKQLTCSNCNNETPFYVKQAYLKQRVFLIPVPTQHHEIVTMCPICESQEVLSRASIFSSKESYEKLGKTLFEGKEITKIWYSKLDAKSKKEHLKRLNALKAFELVRYLSDFA